MRSHNQINLKALVILPWVIDSMTNVEYFSRNAEVVELVDTLASGASGGNPVEVRVLFSVPLNEFKTLLMVRKYS